MRTGARRCSGPSTIWGLRAGQPLQEIAIDTVFIGSCTNGRIEDIRAAAAVAQGRNKVAEGVRALVVPGSGLVKVQAEEEGLDRILTEAGFEWRDAGCSMCLAMNDDRLAPGERSASTSNRNFEGRQGPGGRTHLVSPAMAAAAAVAGHLAGPARPGPIDEGGAPMRKYETVTGVGAPLPQIQYRHRQDHPGALPPDHRALGARPAPVQRHALRRRGQPRTRISCSTSRPGAAPASW